MPPTPPRRQTLWLTCTLLTLALNLANAVMFAFYTVPSDRRVGLFFFALLAPLLLLFIILLFRGRRTHVTTPQNIPCPTCGYNLRGLREARCPECGSAFTLEQLVSAHRDT